jgi:peptide/nickel transport system ATP-binding protein
MTALPATQGRILSVRDLTATFRTPQGRLQAINQVSFDVAPGEILGLVGESGSGKSVTLRAILRLVAATTELTGSVRWGDEDVLSLSDRRMRTLRGREIAMIFQEPMSALNPVLSVFRQIDESLVAHTTLSARQRRARALDLLDLVGIPAAAKRLDDYPHQFSGGMRQRVMIAIAIAAEPRLLLADEPTTALDVTIQSQILHLILSLREKLGMSVVFVTHDLGVVARLCDRVAVMYAGRIAETGTVLDVFRTPHHPYTRGLLDSVPQSGGERKPLLSIEGTPPSLRNMPQGCAFHPRCGLHDDRCIASVPMLETLAPGRAVACFHHDRVSAGGLP